MRKIARCVQVVRLQHQRLLSGAYCNEPFHICAVRLLASICRYEKLSYFTGVWLVHNVHLALRQRAGALGIHVPLAHSLESLVHHCDAASLRSPTW